MKKREDFIFDASEGEFESRVVEASASAPVVVEFWAPWCGACHTLAPVLEKLIRSFKGRLRLARVDTERNPGLAQSWQVQSIPMVKIFKDKMVVGEFIGALPEPKIKDYLEKFAPTELDGLILEGDHLLKRGATEAAEATYYQALGINPQHPGVQLRLADISLRKGEREKARQLAKAIDQGEKEYESASAILARIEFMESCEKAGKKESCELKVRQNPEDLEARYNYALCLAAEQEYPKALEELLFILERDKNFKDKSAHKAVLHIFFLLGEEWEYLDEFRSRLARIIFS